MRKGVYFILGVVLALFWAAGFVFAVEPEQGNVRYFVNVNVANVRSGPGLSEPVIAKLKKGTELKVEGLEDDWYKLTLSDGRTGYIFNDLVSVEGDVSAEPSSDGTAEVEKKAEEVEGSDVSAAGASGGEKVLEGEEKTGEVLQKREVGGVPSSEKEVSGSEDVKGDESSGSKSDEVGPPPVAESGSDRGEETLGGEEKKSEGAVKKVEPAPLEEKKEENITGVEEQKKVEKEVSDEEGEYWLEEDDSQLMYVSLIVEPGVNNIFGDGGIYKDNNLNVHSKAAVFWNRHIGFEAGYGYARIRPGVNVHSVLGGLRGRIGVFPWMRVEPDVMFGWYRFGTQDSFGWQAGTAVLFGSKLYDFSAFMGPFFKYETVYNDNSVNPNMITFGLAVCLTNIVEAF